MVARPTARNDAAPVPPILLRPPGLPPSPPSGRPPDEELPPARTGGRLVELVDGVLLATPADAAPHARAARRLARALEAACEPPLEVFSPFTLRLAGETELLPDVAVVAVDDPLPRYPRDVRLVAEVLSPRSRRTDMALKAQVYADARVPLFLVVDPDAVTLAVHVLRGEGYVQVARAARTSAAAVPDPVPVLLSPADLIRP
ncbi:MAG: Uma2 family endonuclease [Mycobacteriales bacterium]